MARLLIWLALAGVVWWMWTARRRVPPPRPSRAAPAAEPLPTMLRCAHCGVHLPVPEALQGRDGESYCSAAHRELGPPRA